MCALKLVEIWWSHSDKQPEIIRKDFLSMKTKIFQFHGETPEQMQAELDAWYEQNPVTVVDVTMSERAESPDFKHGTHWA